MLFIAALLAAWQIAIDRHPGQLLPGPIGVANGIIDLLQHGLLIKYIVASLFRVTWGFGLAAMLAIPLGLVLGWYRRGEMAFYPLVQVFRPISPLAWIPIAILRFGGGDLWQACAALKKASPWVGAVAVKFVSPVRAAATL